MNSNQAAIDTEVDFLWILSVARNQAGFGTQDRFNANERAAVLLSLVLLNAARSIEGVIRDGTKAIEAAILDTGTENAGAIESIGTDIGAGLAEVLQALGRASCQQDT